MARMFWNATAAVYCRFGLRELAPALVSHLHKTTIEANMSYLATITRSLPNFSADPIPKAEASSPTDNVAGGQHTKEAALQHSRITTPVENHHIP